MNEIELLVPEYPYREKSIAWHASAASVALVMGALGWFAKNYIFIGLVAISWAMLIFRQIRKPRLISLKIGGDGISVGEKLVSYKDIKSFSVWQDGGKNHLILNPAGKMGITLKFPIKNSEAVAEKLNNYIPQVEYEEPLLERLARVLRI